MEQIPTDAEAVHAMRQFGGSFVKALAQAWLVADVVNQQRVKEAFPDYFHIYRNLAAKSKVAA